MMTFSRANFSRFGYYVVLYLEAVCPCVLAAHVKLEERCLRLRSHEEREVDAHKRDCVDRTVPFNETNQRTRQDKTRQEGASEKREARYDDAYARCSNSVMGVLCCSLTARLHVTAAEVLASMYIGVGNTQFCQPVHSPASPSYYLAWRLGSVG